MWAILESRLRPQELGCDVQGDLGVGVGVGAGGRAGGGLVCAKKG